MVASNNKKSSNKVKPADRTSIKRVSGRTISDISAKIKSPSQTSFRNKNTLQATGRSGTNTLSSETSDLKSLRQKYKPSKASSSLPESRGTGPRPREVSSNRSVPSLKVLTTSGEGTRSTGTSRANITAPSAISVLDGDVIIISSDHKLSPLLIKSKKSSAATDKGKSLSSKSRGKGSKNISKVHTWKKSKRKRNTKISPSTSRGDPSPTRSSLFPSENYEETLDILKTHKQRDVFNPCFICRENISLRTWCRIIGIIEIVLFSGGILLDICGPVHMKQLNQAKREDKTLATILFFVAAVGFVGSSICLIIASGLNLSIFCIFNVVLMVVTIISGLTYMILSVQNSVAIQVEIFFLITVNFYAGLCALGLYCQYRSGLYDARIQMDSMDSDYITFIADEDEDFEL